MFIETATKKIPLILRRSRARGSAPNPPSLHF
jgi:hypothetical protein